MNQFWLSIYQASILYRSYSLYLGSSLCFHVSFYFIFFVLFFFYCFIAFIFTTSHRCRRFPAPQDYASLGQTHAGRQLISAIHRHLYIKTAKEHAAQLWL